MDLEKEAKQKECKENAFVNFFVDDAFSKNIPAIRQYNLEFSKLFNAIALCFMSVLFISTFVSDYALSLRMIYVIFIVVLLSEELIICVYPPKGTWWITPLCYLGMIQIYAFCIISGVIYNVDEIAINYHVFLILLPLSVLLPFRRLLAIQTLSLVAFGISTFAFKSPSLATQDLVCAIVYYVMGLAVTERLNKVRVEYLGLYQERDESEKRNALLLDATPVGITKLKFTGTSVEPLYANKPAIEMVGYSIDEFKAKGTWDLTEIVHPEDIHHISDSLRNPELNSGYTYDFRLKNKKDSKYYWVACKFTVIEIGSGSVTALVDLLDIDAQKRAEDASAAKSRFLSRMSHEIRTPINAIMGIAELERQDIDNHSVKIEDLDRYSKETMAASEYLLTLVNDVLDTSRIENNQIEITKQKVDANQYLADVHTLIEPLAKEKNINLIFERKTNTHANYIGDSVRVKQIIVNLLNNAIKFTPPGGTVRLVGEAIAMDEDHTTLQFTVSDNGIGMSKEFQDKLFTPFSQEHSSITSPYAGTGLGLNIAKSLAMKMGGDITCTSEQGKGTTFVATIVVDNDHGQFVGKIPSHVKKDTLGELNFENLRILVCEDHPLNQKITRALLERKKCKVEIAADGVIAVDMFEKSAIGYYSMVLMDIRMPNMDGLQATKEIRQLDRTDAKTVPIVAMSANAYEEDVRKSIVAGMNDHLSKPVDADKLYQAIAYFTQQKFVQADKPKILVVDDMETNRVIISEVLQTEYQVLEAENGVTAMKQLEANPDIIAVVTDIQMPNMDGVKLIKAIREKYRYNDVAILVNTQYGAAEQEDEMIALGADDFVYKPTSPVLLEMRLKNVLARRRHIL